MKRKRMKLMAEINLTPFTDVVLVLLVIFMVTTPLIIQSGIKVKLPKTTTADTEEGRNAMLTIDREGYVYLEGKKIDLTALKSKLSEKAAYNPESSVIISGDAEVRYDYVIKVLDVAKQAGFKRFALATEIKKQ